MCSGDRMLVRMIRSTKKKMAFIVKKKPTSKIEWLPFRGDIACQ